MRVAGIRRGSLSHPKPKTQSLPAQTSTSILDIEPTTRQASSHVEALATSYKVKPTWQVKTQSAPILGKFPELETLRLMHNWKNCSIPSLGTDWWLYLDPRPPFYMRIGVNCSIPLTITPPINHDYGPEETKLPWASLGEQVPVLFPQVIIYQLPLMSRLVKINGTLTNLTKWEVISRPHWEHSGPALLALPIVL